MPHAVFQRGCWATCVRSRRRRRHTGYGPGLVLRMQVRWDGVQILNDPWPWWGTLRGQLTVADLIASGTLSPEGAASLWWVIDHGASVFVAAGPPGAGKSTVANALLEFLPDDAQVYVTSGSRDHLEIPSAPGPVYLLVNELSGHMPVYLFGGAAQRAFGLLRTGVRLLGTLHARSAAEAVRVMCDEAEVARTEVTTPFVFAIISAGWSDQRLLRRIVELGLLVQVQVTLADRVRG